MSNELSGVGQPTITETRLVFEAHVGVRDAPSFVVGRHEMSAFKLTIIYRRYAHTEPWELLNIIVHGTWLNGGKQGKADRRRYTRGMLDSLPVWVLTLVENNDPGK